MNNNNNMYIKLKSICNYSVVRDDTISSLQFPVDICNILTYLILYNSL